MTGIAEELAQLLSDMPEIKLAFLFGSQAHGRSSSKSDIDLALLAAEPLQSARKLELIEAIGLEFGRSVDIVDLHDAPEPILGEVFRGQRLLGDNATYAQLLTRHLLNTADYLPLRQRILSERRQAWID